jgi:MoxR-like ATPase
MAFDMNVTDQVTMPDETRPIEPMRTSGQVVATVSQLATQVAASVRAVVAGNDETIETSIACLLAGGHLLIEDIPGVGKTLLAQALAASVGGTFHRIQGTPDLLPGDVTGTMVPRGDGFELVFQRRGIRRTEPGEPAHTISLA